ncbi:class I SAM-dependent methyltransferase [Pseudodesulfovibrio sp.]|uniref:class I SAM-dependent methyltransferase n=1 Tax=unclassified Pseudodesulfovibrio TaxID=2661612 RepID=UPI003AFF7D69
MDFQRLKSSIIDSSVLRKGVCDLVPEGATRVLDVGCGRGGILLRLQRDKGCTELYGVDMDKKAISELRPFVDYAEVVDIEADEIMPERFKGFFNIIIMHDFVEHLFDPWQTLTKIRQYLAEDGLAIIATPNLLNWHLQHKIMSGKFPYGHGLWHSGHLRWYTPASLLDVLVIGGFKVQQYCLELMDGTPLDKILVNRKLTTIQIPPIEIQHTRKEEPFTIQYPRDIRASYPAFFAHKIIAVCSRGPLLWEPQPLTYNIELLHSLTQAINNQYDLFNPPPMHLIMPGSFPREPQ